MRRFTARPRMFLLSCLLGAFLVGATASLFTGPRTPDLGSARSGDPELVRDVQSVLGSEDRYPSLSVVRVRDGRVSYAGLGETEAGIPTPQTPYELGSITKTFTGLLLADAVQRREMKLDDPVANYLTELRGTAVGESTLGQLATHTAGLPQFPDSMVVGVLLRTVANQNTYDGSTAAMLEATRTTKVTARGTYKYSNLGMSLLGHAEARAAKAADWPTLATDRLLRPLRMQHTHFAMSTADLPADGTRPHNENGWPAANWYGPAFAPAGSSTWTTAEDLGLYSTALLAGRVPGAAAMRPVAPTSLGEIGLAWQIREVSGRQITWHNGATGGFRTILALDRERGQAVAILSNDARSADSAGRRLAATSPGSPLAPVARGAVPWRTMAPWAIVGLILLVSFAVSMLRGRTKLAVVTAALSGLTGLVVLLAHGPWSLVPGWIWGGLAGLTAVFIGVGVVRARTLPAYADRRRILGWLSLVSTVVVLGLAVATM